MRKLERPEVREKLLEMAASGPYTMEQLAGQVGVTRDTLWQETKRDLTFQTAFMHARDIGWQRSTVMASRKAWQYINTYLDQANNGQDVVDEAPVARLCLAVLERANPSWSAKIDHTLRDKGKQAVESVSDQEEKLAMKIMKLRARQRKEPANAR